MFLRGRRKYSIRLGFLFAMGKERKEGRKKRVSEWVSEPRQKKENSMSIIRII